MNTVQFNLANNSDSHCYAVYEDKNTGLIERSLIVSPLLYDKIEDFKVPHIIVKLEPEGFYKSIKIKELDTIIVTSIQWLPADKIDNSQRTAVS